MKVTGTTTNYDNNIMAIITYPVTTTSNNCVTIMCRKFKYNSEDSELQYMN